MMKTRYFGAVIGTVLLAGGLAIAQPKKNISAARHPNLSAAQTACQHAWEKIGEAQQANEFDMQGHAAKAKQLWKRRTRN